MHSFYSNFSHRYDAAVSGGGCKGISPLHGSKKKNRSEIGRSYLPVSLPLFFFPNQLDTSNPGKREYSTLYTPDYIYTYTYYNYTVNNYFSKCWRCPRVQLPKYAHGGGKRRHSW